METTNPKSAAPSAEMKETKKKDKKPKTLKEKIIENLKILLSAYLIAFAIRLFMIEAYQIPSESMVPSLLIGDILMVEKVSFGTILPLAHLKLPGFFTPQRNDIIVFVSPEWQSPGLIQEFISLISLSLINLDNTFENPKNLVKRLIALPGDTLMMTNQILYINGAPLDYTACGSVLNQKYYRVFEEKYSNQTRIVQHIEGLNMTYYMKENELLWQFDTIRVPKRGEVVSLTNINPYFMFMMKLLIERESGKTVPVTPDGRLFMDNKQLKEWKVSQNYYFAMGDNRDESKDCRYFGFIPEQNIFGRILFRYFPFHRFGFNPNENSESIRKLKF